MVDGREGGYLSRKVLEQRGLQLEGVVADLGVRGVRGVWGVC